MTAPLYTVLALDLTSAGSEVVHGPWGLVRLLDAVNGSGTVQTDVKLTVQAGREGEGVPMRLGHGFLAAATERWLLTWDAQPGITATLGFAESAGIVDWDADPPAKLVTGSLSITQPATLQTVADTVVVDGTTGLLTGATADRRHALVQAVAGGQCRVGDSAAGAARGIRLNPGDVMRIEGTAPIYVHAPAGGGNITVALLHVRD